jgi:hypothetical protein
MYKLLYQAARGAEHAVRDEQTARDWLDHELKEMGDGPQEILIDPISPDGKIVRVHLRPYLEARKDPEKLLQAFVRTANEWRGSPLLLRKYGQAAALWVDSNPQPVTAAAIHSFFAKMERQGFPAAHHSEIYRSLYRPAYRAVAQKFLEGG